VDEDRFVIGKEQWTKFLEIKPAQFSRTMMQEIKPRREPLKIERRIVCLNPGSFNSFME
jgi:hypothetical protein